MNFKVSLIILAGFFLALGPTEPKMGTFTDNRDGKIYKTVKIGAQTWMAENLAYKPDSGKYWAYNDDTANVQLYGYLYNWKTAKFVCPAGWHLPTMEEWEALINRLGGRKVAAKAMKNETGWIEKSNCTNSSGFSALPAGYRRARQTYGGAEVEAHWWTSTPSRGKFYKDMYAWRIDIDNYPGWVDIFEEETHNHCGQSVRCIKDKSK